MKSESENQNANVAEADLPEIDPPAENQNTDDDVVEVESGSGPEEKKPVAEVREGSSVAALDSGVAKGMEL
ncbi:hypothetical protein ACET3Z_032631 [Daucus carota]